MANTTCGALDVFDQGGGSILLQWRVFPGAAPDSYNVYLNGTLNQNVAVRTATITGLQVATYINQVKTLPPVYTMRVAAVKAGVETACSPDAKVTPQPTSIMLTTPMRRPYPFPNTAPGG